MKHLIVSFYIFFPTLFVFAQPALMTNPPQLDFGVVTENAPDSLTVWIKNPHFETVEIEGFRFYNTYESPAFTTQSQGFSLAPGDSQQIFIRFSPVHNIAHNSEMVILTNSPYGDASVDLIGQGRYSNGYYSGTENLSEQALKTALKTRISQGYTQFSYNDARDQMFMAIDNQKVNGQGAAVNTLEGVYTGVTITGYADRTNAQFMGFNTEHTYPQSFFSQNLPMRSDLYHLFPTKSDANSQRSNLPFGVVNGTPAWQEGGSKRGNGVFEPRDVHKGSVARAMFYFVIRYQNYGNFLNSQESILRQWHKAFPPTAENRKRNSDIALLQKNRNPFIDYPQFLDRITSVSGNSVAPQIRSMDLIDDVIDFDTLLLSSVVRYHFILVNKGNQPLDITNMSLSDSQLSFKNIAGTGITIPVGESADITVEFDPVAGGSLNATFEFNTNDPANASLSIPVIAEVTDNTSVESLAMPEWISVFPNPTSHQLTLVSEKSFLQGEITLISYDGRKIFTDVWNGEEKHIFLETNPPGMYLLTVETHQQRFSRRIILIR